jgi:hypothetical protein
MIFVWFKIRKAAMAKEAFNSELPEKMETHIYERTHDGRHRYQKLSAVKTSDGSYQILDFTSYDSSHEVLTENVVVPGNRLYTTSAAPDMDFAQAVRRLHLFEKAILSVPETKVAEETNRHYTRYARDAELDLPPLGNDAGTSPQTPHP